MIVRLKNKTKTKILCVAHKFDEGPSKCKEPGRVHLLTQTKQNCNACNRGRSRKRFL